MSGARKQVEDLHQQFCALTGRHGVPVRFHERAWFEILRSPEYDGNAEQLGLDVAHLVKYLQRGIANDKRNAGCLKLVNFLQPDKFFEDLAESKVQMRPRKPARPEIAQTRTLPDGGKVSVLGPAPEKLEVPAIDVAAELRRFADGMKGGQPQKKG